LAGLRRLEELSSPADSTRGMSNRVSADHGSR